MLKGDLKWKIPLIIVCVLFCAWYLAVNSINLGLDLQGGLHLVLKVETDTVIVNELVQVKDYLSREFKKQRIPFDAMSVEADGILKITAASAEELQKISEYVAEEFPRFEKKGILGSGTVLNLSMKAKEVESWKETAIQQALRTIRNRIDEFGVSEPMIQRQGKSRIIVELPGVKDLQRAIDLLGKTAELRFQLVKDIAATQEELLKRHDGKVPSGYTILLSAPDANSSGRQGAYLVEKEARVTGADLQDARVSKDELNMPAVSFEFNHDGARTFGKLTEENIGTPLAIVLDGTVQSAPTIQSRITSRGQITGNFTSEEATDLAIVLRAGALPAPVKILENISVGPSLGEDSIAAGKNAIMLGGLFVIIFMLLYYKVSGLIADLALLFNFLFIMGVLAYFRATLTLPGLAGIALTVGMAVDANVLIYERIKEELRKGKTLRSAVEKGFSRAHLTILDANLTTLIAAIVLFQFGTGPVKGFAVTLSIGIFSTLFTALILSKVIFDLVLQSGTVKRLSI
ncbi:protein translocase subunit SecD [candidate division KSB3 bacterium]|uniref:Protein translocase subunit SecD n=1 Tax=candidate division KSB3 bacterium TaxID=2044937 RepID=A0A2G6E6L6_9BACT|nr:MAG: protein translocase subunit SecD [candidate division KSB3 bacterium]PIE30154.1 MAG: protein translocase subunit SecD [candidate division KSB3 bacterium]